MGSTWTTTSLGVGFVLAAGAVLGSGCSSGSSGGSGGKAISCDSLCEKIVAAQCPNDTTEKCLSDCHDDLANAGSCSSQLSSFFACAIDQPLTCDSSGEATIDENATVDNCFPEVKGYARCSECVIDSNADPCENCEKQSCCSELRSIYDDPNFKSYYLCYQGCQQDPSCATTCLSQFPTIKERGTAVTTCFMNKCASVCS